MEGRSYPESEICLTLAYWKAIIRGRKSMMEGKVLAIKKELQVKDKFITIELPDEFKEHKVEVIVRLKRDIEQEILADQIRIDTRRWRFQRDEIYAE